MKTSKKVMTEVIESDKEIIERITRENYELKEKQNEVEKILDSIGIEENYEGFVEFLRFLYKNKDDFIEYINIDKNNVDIEDNILFKEIKEQNIKLTEEIKNIKYNNKDSLNTPINNNFDEENFKNNIYKEIEQNITDKIKKENELKYSNDFIGLNNTINLLNKTVEELRKRCNYLEKNKKNNNNIPKNKKTSDKFIIYYDTTEEWKKWYASKTYRRMLDYKLFDKFINEDNKVNKENYEEIEHYINKYEIGNYKSPYIKNKIKRCIDLISHFGNKIEYVKFNLSEISRMSDKNFNKWKNILDVKLNNNDSSSEEEMVKTDDEKITKNGNIKISTSTENKNIIDKDINEISDILCKDMKFKPSSLCIACNINKRENSSFCNKCAQPVYI